MCRNKKMYLIVGLILTAVLSVTACGTKKTLLSDVGADISQEKDRSEYLDIGILSGENKETETYSTTVLAYGDFIRTGGPKTGYISMEASGGTVVRVQIEKGTMTFINMSFLNNFYGSYVNEGDVLATVRTEVDSADILQAELELSRLRQQYERAEKEFYKQREKRLLDNKLIYDQYQKKADSILLERDLMEWEQTAGEYERKIKESEEAVTDLKKWANTTEICAPVRGQPYLIGYPLKSGEEIKNGAILCSIADADSWYKAVDNQDLSYKYGMKTLMTISEEIKFEVGIITGTEEDLYGNLNPGQIVYLRPQGNEAKNDDWLTSREGRLENTHTMENVLLVPKKAVTEEDGVLYVTVVKPDGSFLKTGFTAGGDNSEYYWVADGLEEGMELLLVE